MKKLKLIILCVAIIMALSMMLYGCSFAFGDDEEGLQIDKIERAVDNDGKVYLEIYYKNIDSVTRVLVPDGNGIVDTQFEFDDENKETVITLSYLNGEKEYVHVRYGKDGVDAPTINMARLVYDLAGKPYIVFYNESADGTVAEQCRVDVASMQGKDGIGIVSWVFFSDELGEGVSIKLTGQETPNNYYFYYYKDITCELVGNYYAIKISDNNPLTSDQIFYISRMPTWLSGNSMPDDELDGIVGDFYYDLRRQIIYVKVTDNEDGVSGGYWKEVARLSTEQNKTCSIIFDAGLGTLVGYDMYQISEGRYKFDNIPYGSYFLDRYNGIPVPTLEGYTFVGWYRSFLTGEGEVAFNDFVQICSDMTLYARWQKND